MLPINCPGGGVGGTQVRIKLLPADGPTTGQSGCVMGLPWELIYNTDAQDPGLRASVWGPGICITASKWFTDLQLFRIYQQKKHRRWF